MADLELAPRTKEEQQEFAHALQEVDVDNSGTYGFSEFLKLLKWIKEKQLTEQQDEELKAGLEMGFTEEEVDQFRDVFGQFDADRSGHLDLQEIRALMRALSKNPS